MRGGGASVIVARMERIIEPGASQRDYWRELWQRRGLITHMAWSDIVVRYKQTYLGLAWALFQPVVSVIVFTLVFSRLARLPSVGGAPYPLMVFGAVLPWQLFATGLTSVANSLIYHRDLVTGIYFPRLVLPLKALAVSLHNTLISLGLLLVALVAYGYLPDWRVVTLPLFLLLACTAAMALGLWIAILNVRYRDFQYLVPYFLQVAMYISPVGFSTDIVPWKWRFLYSLNPMVGAIDGARWALFHGAAYVHPLSLPISVAVTLLLLAGGVRYFRRSEGAFADRI